MLKHLDIYWALFLVVWLSMLAIRIWANLKIDHYKHKQKPLNPFFHQRSGFQMFLIAVFTIYNRPFRLHDPKMRLLKIRSNILHQLFIYSFIFSFVLTYVAFIQYTMNESDNENYSRYENKGPETDIIENPNTKYGLDYNSKRRKMGLIPLPTNFRMSNTSNSRSEIWKHENPYGLEYYHELKYVYLENGKWAGEYDIFVHKRPNQMDVSLNVNVTTINDTVYINYRRDTEDISEGEFLNTLDEWGLGSEVE